MKGQAFIILSALYILSACNNNEEKTVSEPTTATTSGEKKLLEEIKKYPDSVLLQEDLIQYYRDSSAFGKAIGFTDGLLSKDSNNARLWDIKATLHFENDDTLEAIQAFEKAVAIFPDPAYVMSLGSLYAQTKNAKALNMADMLLMNKNANAAKEGFFIKGIYFSYTGDKKKAIDYFDKCLSLEYTFMFAYREKAIVLYDLGKYGDAVKVLDKAVTLQNNFDEGYYWKGRCLEKLNRQDEAIEAYRMALLYSPDFTEAKEALARLGGK